MAPLVLNIPHASTLLPEELLGGLYVPYERVQAEALSQTDLFCDDLFSCKQATRVVAKYSRFVCDVERFADDSQEPMSCTGQGFFYTNFLDGTCFRGTELREKIKSEVFDLYHDELTRAVDAAMSNGGHCLIVDCHSFALDGDMPDVCIGADSFHTPQPLVELTKNFFEASGYSVAINNPYSGTVVPLKYLNEDPRASSIMIELNRKLYLASDYSRSDGYQDIKDLCSQYLDTLWRAEIDRRLNELLVEPIRNSEYLDLCHPSKTDLDGWEF